MSTVCVRFRRRRTSALLCRAIILASLVSLPTSATATAKAKSPVASTKKYCAAAKAWMAFETRTLETGPYDQAWVQETKRLLIPLGANTPKSQRGYMATFIITLVADRSLVAGIDAITSADDIQGLRDAAADAQGSVTQFAARNAVGIYTQKTCKFDVLKPFRDLAAGFN